MATLGSFLFSFFLTSCHQRRHQCLATTASGLNGDNGRVDVVALAVRRRDESGWRKAQREWLERGGGCGDQPVLLYGSEMWVLTGLRDSIFAQHTGWQRSMCLGGGRISSGYTHPQIRCWRSVGCTPLSTTLMCKGRQSQGTWSTKASLLNARGQTEGTVQCLGGGGGSRRCAWTTFDALGSRN